MIDGALQDLGLSLLKESQLGQNALKAAQMIQSVQEQLRAIQNIEETPTVFSFKTGSVLVLTIMKKLAAKYGSFVVLNDPDNKVELSKDDWMDILKEVDDTVLLSDASSFCVYVFKGYADYIEYSVKLIEAYSSEKTVNSISMLSQELRGKTEEYESDRLSEVKYTEECLWISLEAMIKLLAAFVGLPASIIKGTVNKEGSIDPNMDVHELYEAVASYAFEYGRLYLYSWEQRMLDEFIAQQDQLDADLEKEFASYKKTLQAYYDQFNDLIKNAFDTDIRKSLQNTAKLAEAAGVSKDEILETTEDVDDFFMN